MKINDEIAEIEEMGGSVLRECERKENEKIYGLIVDLREEDEVVVYILAMNFRLFLNCRVL